ncbi:polysaccharide deacetylase family protein, PEP-CTERM locus subfamily [Arboricoccus pini]|uniref:Chitooligosaccharide deacetylase n=1 Tax=Arboricoccus pini TaxID=1963835 RepID=A0A212R3Z6_9PROT|nr:polysaccharide deacetylase family protein [Arboricoccus pini]SNB66734.1 polysaccharide deacetylase family protein, PEP-CTERM locus subfamily [Arboricoccus pini]
MTPQDFACLPELFTFTVDVEAHREGSTGIARCRQATHAILDFLESGAQQGTFFILGSLAKAAPDIVRAIAQRGHEIASHAVDHLPMERQDRQSFGQEIKDSRHFLEDLSSSPVLGFRAPFFSLTSKAEWAIAELLHAGFTYSSSIVPGRSFVRSWPGAPADPFLWPGGLLELPCPIGRLGRLPMGLPCLGGINLRYLPAYRLRRMLKTIKSRAIWTYCHPYEFDLDEPYGLAPGIGPLASYLLWANRRTLIERLGLFMQGRRSVAFAQRMAEIRGYLPAAG